MELTALTPADTASADSPSSFGARLHDAAQYMDPASAAFSEDVVERSQGWLDESPDDPSFF